MWLIGERKGEAKDNGYHLFKYIRENHTDEKLYYIIEENSNDIKKICKYENIIYYDTFKHYVYYCLARKLICAHAGSTVPSSPIFWKLRENGIFNKKLIYIKHGIIKEKIKTHMYKNTKYDVIVCGAKPEYEFVKSELGYPEENVKYLGLCRFDKLHRFKTKKQIFMMLTWRQWFDMEECVTDVESDRKRFLTSNYFKALNNFLQDKDFIKVLENEGIELIFHPHHEMQRYREFFKPYSKNIIIANEKEYDVQELLKSSEILITDYSSIAFDFAYMKKPILYYQFDSEEYYKKHYSKGYFEYEEDGFGKVSENAKDLIKNITELISNGTNELYIKRAEKFFEINDSNNCKRTYNCIKAL